MTFKRKQKAARRRLSNVGSLSFAPLVQPHYSTHGAALRAQGEIADPESYDIDPPRMTVRYRGLATEGNETK